MAHELELRIFELMKKYIFLFLMISVPAFAQIDYSFSGYVADMPIYSKNNPDLARLFSYPNNQFINLTRVRLRPEVYLWSGARLNMEYEADALYSPQNVSVLFNEINTNRQVFNLKWNIVDKENLNILHYIDRLYMRQGFSWGNIIVGRQRIAWGVGRVWSPTDLFNPINPANFSKIEKDGADAASLTYYLGNFTDLNLVYNPQEKIENSNYGFRFRTNVMEYDLAFVGGYFDNRVILGGDFAGNFFDAGIRGEGIISMDKNNLRNNYTKIVFGMDNQFTSKLYALFEYQYNGQGATDKLKYDFTGLIDGRLLNLSRNYLYVSGTYQLTPLLSLTLAENSNLNDGSGFAMVGGTYSLSNNATLDLGSLITYGNKYTEYWYYPTSYYLQCQYFF